MLVLLLALMAFAVTSGVLVAPAYASAPPPNDAASAGGVSSPSAVTPLPVDKSGGFKPDPDGYLSEWEYQDASLSVRIVGDRIHDTDYLVAYIKVADPSQVRTAVAGRHNSQETVPGATIAKRVNAVLAINGDFYSFRPNGYIIRQAQGYHKIPNGLDILFIDDRGDLHAVESPTRESVAGYLASLNGRQIINSFTFGPLLVRDGAPITKPYSSDVAAGKQTQRMGIAQIGPLEYLCVSTEGPEDPGSSGLTIEQFAGLMESLGADIAYNLDGGSSNTLVFGNKKINSPNNPKVRPIFDILYFATAIDSER